MHRELTIRPSLYFNMRVAVGMRRHVHLLSITCGALSGTAQWPAQAGMGNSGIVPLLTNLPLGPAI